MTKVRGPGGRGSTGGRACAQRGRGRPGGEKEEGLRPRKAGVGDRPAVAGWLRRDLGSGSPWICV